MEIAEAGAPGLLLVERRDRTVFVTLNRPAAANALSRALVAELTRLCGDLGREIGAGTDLRALVLTGAGDKAFSAGADLKERRTWTLDDTRIFLGEINALMNAIAAFPRPTVAAINGVAFGGGLELALACDIRIAAASAEMGLTEVRLGIIPGAGGTQRLARIAGVAAAKELILTGRRIGAARARELGICQRGGAGGGAVGGGGALGGGDFGGGAAGAGRGQAGRRRRAVALARRRAQNRAGPLRRGPGRPTIATRGWRPSSKSGRPPTKDDNECHAATNSRRWAPRSRRAGRPSTTRPTPPPASCSAASGSRCSATRAPRTSSRTGSSPTRALPSSPPTAWSPGSAACTGDRWRSWPTTRP